MKDRRVEGWEAVVDKHVGLVLDLNNMQEDGKMRLLYPELVRSVSPLADAVVRERKLAGALRPTDPSIHERVEDSAYFRAVERLESAIKEFVAHAKRTGWGNLTPEERVQQSLALENYYQRQEANNKPLRSKVFGFVG